MHPGPLTLKNFPTNIPYGTVYTEVPRRGRLLLGYGKHLEFLGFTYNTFNKDLEEIENWRLSCKEFMFRQHKIGEKVLFLL